MGNFLQLPVATKPGYGADRKARLLSALRRILPAGAREALKRLREDLLLRSLKNAGREQNLIERSEELRVILPDISGQYTTYKLDSPFLELAVRLLQSFQVELVMQALAALEFRKDAPLTIADIGDSSGSHLVYLQSLLLKNGFSQVSCLGVNLDAVAVEKIKSRGIAAVHCRAEELAAKGISADLFLSFETIEHLLDPIRFLKQLVSNPDVRVLVVTVPYLSQSRVGLHYIRAGQEGDVCAENTHIYEFCPEDWMLIARFSGWDVLFDKIYYQYPARGVLRVTKPLWKNTDFEGYYGMALVPNSRWAERYKSW